MTRIGFDANFKTILMITVELSNFWQAAAKYDDEPIKNAERETNCFHKTEHRVRVMWLNKDTKDCPSLKPLLS